MTTQTCFDDNNLDLEGDQETNGIMENMQSEMAWILLINNN